MPIAERHHAYLNKMIAVRLCMLPFYILSCLLVYLWSRDLFGSDAALWSLALYVTLSTVTGHASLANTDMAYTALFLWALMAGIQWMYAVGWKKSVILGISLGLLIGTKFSGLAQWPAAMLLIVLAQAMINHSQKRPILPIGGRHIINGVFITLPLLVLVLGILYHFHFGVLLDGILKIMRISSNGFAVWLYGPLNNHGVWYFFPVVFFFKTPLSLLAAATIGSAVSIYGLRRHSPGKTVTAKHLFPLAGALGILLISMTTNYNLGVRHVLPLYPLLSIPAGYGLLQLWRKKIAGRLAATSLLLCQFTAFIASSPEHISYFNMLAGDHPEHIAIDSDFDWAQGYIMLDEALETYRVDSVYVCAQGWHVVAWNARMLLHATPHKCPTSTPEGGWIAVSRAQRQFRAKNLAWLDGHQAIQRIGRTFDLYYLPPE